MHTSSQTHKWKLTYKEEPMKDPTEADIDHTFMSEDGRAIKFDGESGIEEWNKIGGEKKVNRQMPKRKYLTMAPGSNGKRKQKIRHRGNKASKNTIRRTK